MPADDGRDKKRRTFRASDDEWAEWGRRARHEGIKPSAWLRRALNERAALERSLIEQGEEHVDGQLNPVP